MVAGGNYDGAKALSHSRSYLITFYHLSHSCWGLDFVFDFFFFKSIELKSGGTHNKGQVEERVKNLLGYCQKMNRIFRMIDA